MLVDVVPLESISFKDTETYFGILLDNNTRKWICRIKLGEKTKTLMLPASDNKMSSTYLERLEDLYLFKQQVIESAQRFN